VLHQPPAALALVAVMAAGAGAARGSMVAGPNERNTMTPTVARAAAVPAERDGRRPDRRAQEQDDA
jgi:hypothetical protein